MTKVVLLTASISRDGGGVSEAVKTLAGAFAETDLRLEVITLRDDSYDRDLVDWSGIKVTAARVFGPKKYGFSFDLLKKLFESDADVVHVHGIWMYQCLACLIWSIFSGKRYYVSPHGMLDPWILKRSALLKSLISRVYQRKFFANSSGVLALTIRERDEVHCYSPSSVVDVIPNTVSVGCLTTRDPGWWRPDFQEKTVFLFLGRIHVKKGWRELLAGWDAACRRDPDFSRKCLLVFCGWEDGQVGDLQKAIDSRPSPPNVLFAGPTFGIEKEASFVRASVFCLPSFGEGLPLSVLEAWSHSVPTIMTRECNMDIGFEYGAALQVRPSADSVAAGLLAFFSRSAEARLRMNQAALSVVKEHFSAASVRPRYLTLYANKKDAP